MHGRLGVSRWSRRDAAVRAISSIGGHLDSFYFVFGASPRHSVLLIGDPEQQVVTRLRGRRKASSGQQLKKFLARVSVGPGTSAIF